MNEASSDDDGPGERRREEARRRVDWDDQEVCATLGVSNDGSVEMEYISSSEFSCSYDDDDVVVLPSSPPCGETTDGEEIVLDEEILGGAASSCSSSSSSDVDGNEDGDADFDAPRVASSSAAGRPSILRSLRRRLLPDPQAAEGARLLLGRAASRLGSARRALGGYL